jgi:hypothetical protein
MVYYKGTPYRAHKFTQINITKVHPFSGPQKSLEINIEKKLKLSKKIFFRG